MKTWIIVLTIIYVVLRLVRTLLANYIKNDKTERLKYYFTDGETTLGLIYGITYLLSLFSLTADVILVFILWIDKL